MSANIGFGLFCFVIALITVAIAWSKLRADRNNVRLAAASGAWSTVNGQIGSVRIDATRPEQGAAYFEPKVDYTYTVADRQYAGTRINFLRLDFLGEKKAQSIIANYAAGAATMVAYDPVDPENSVLDRITKPPALSFWTGVIIAVAVVMAAGGVVIMNIPG
jgi:hypothetical protein